MGGSRFAFVWGLPLFAVCACAVSSAATDGDGAPIAPDAAQVSDAGHSGGARIRSSVQHTCAITRDGALYCWGVNAEGQLGDGTTRDAAEPLRMEGDHRWRDVGTGSAHTCAIRDDGSLWCWGRNAEGQLGDGTRVPRVRPARVETDTDWRTLALGGGHSCGIRSDGTLWCWGGRDYHATPPDDAAVQPANLPVRVGDFADWVEVSAHWYAIDAIRRGGSLWRMRDSDQPATFRQVGTATDWAHVAVGPISECGTRTDGSLWCWGGVEFPDPPGSLESEVPVRIGTDIGWSGALAVSYHACAGRTDGALWCWGRAGALGRSVPDRAALPGAVDFRGRFTQVAAGWAHTCALADDEAVWCWGDLPGTHAPDGGRAPRVTLPTRVAGPLGRP